MPSWPINFDLVIQGDIALIELTATVRATARAIQGVPLTPATADRLHRLNIVRAVSGTTGIEGVTLNEEEVDNILYGNPPSLPPSRQREEQEVRNAQKLFLRVEELLRNDPQTLLTEQMVREFHSVITQNIDYRNNTPGRYRSQVVVAGTYRAPEAQEVPELMRKFIAWLNEGRGAQLDPIMRAVIAHFLLVSIHPFGDGNGRLSRGVESFLLYKAGINARGFYSLSNFYYQNRQSYIDALDHVRFVSNPDATPFARFALQGLAEELDYVHKVVIDETRMIAFHDYAGEMIAHGGGLGRPTGRRQLNFIRILKTQQVAIADIRSGGHVLAGLYRRVGNRTLSRDINTLRNLGLIVYENDVVRANIDVIDQYTVGGR